MVSAEPFSHGTGTLLCLQKEMATYRQWFVFLWRDPDDVPHCRILSPDKNKWRLISATFCGWRRCFVADQLWSMTCIREEEEVQRLREQISLCVWHLRLALTLALDAAPTPTWYALRRNDREISRTDPSLQLSHTATNITDQYVHTTAKWTGPQHSFGTGLRLDKSRSYQKVSRGPQCSFVIGQRLDKSGSNQKVN